MARKTINKKDVIDENRPAGLKFWIRGSIAVSLDNIKTVDEWVERIREYGEVSITDVKVLSEKEMKEEEKF